MLAKSKIKDTHTDILKSKKLQNIIFKKLFFPLQVLLFIKSNWAD